MFKSAGPGMSSLVLLQRAIKILKISCKALVRNVLKKWLVDDGRNLFLYQQIEQIYKS